MVLAAVPHGGITFAYNDVEVRMWAPDKRNWDYNWVYGSGRMIYVGRGWAGNTMAQDSLSAEVRVLAWSTMDGA